MTSYLSDRQRVEALLFPQMLWAVVEAGVADKTQADFQECQRLLREAMEEPALFASSRKHARKVLEQLQRHGYFGGVPLAEAA